MIGNDTVGGGYFLDLRDGPRHGCVRTWDKTEADEWDADAESLAEPIERVIEAVRSDGQVDNAHPVIIDGMLDWRYA